MVTAIWFRRLHFAAIATWLLVLCGAAAIDAQQSPVRLLAAGGYFHLDTCINVRAASGAREVTFEAARAGGLPACRVCSPERHPAFAHLVDKQLLIAGRVDRVVDGDTIVLSEIGAVRLIGVDAAELTDDRPEMKTLGRISAAYLSGLILGKNVRLEHDTPLTDRFDRRLAYVFLSDGLFVNEEIIRRGYANVYTEYPFKHLDRFRRAAEEARSAKAGLWASPEAVLFSVPAAPATAPAKPLPAAGAVGAVAATEAGATGADAKDEITVYTTRTGTKYHRETCRTLSASKIPMPLKEAAARFEPCSVCNPPKFSPAEPVAAQPSPTTAKPAPVRSSTPTTKQCAATTQKGTRCSRTASAGSSYCWQHGRSH